ncbi:hypothetical protein GCM10027059_22320 [Myceligenerans halotolerans]
MTTTIAFFNSRAGVGTTTLAYHLAHMFSRLGVTVLAADLDPQSTLTSMFLDESEQEELWSAPSPPTEQEAACSEHPVHSPRVHGVPTIADGVRSVLEGVGDSKEPGDVGPVRPAQIDSGLWLLPGSIDLSRFEDQLARAWPESLAGEYAAFETTTAVPRIVARASEHVRAEVVIIDVGPSLDAVSRATLLAADHVLVPLTADIVSLRGLSNLGPALRRWRREWQDRISLPLPGDFVVPPGAMDPLGYVVMQSEMRLDRPVNARWLARIPEEFSTAVLGAGVPGDRPDEIATLRNYRSLMPLAHDARKPMFDLRAADGAMGSTQAYVTTCFQEFRSLAERVLSLVGVSRS